MPSESRKELVESLIAARFPLQPILSELAEYPWDCDEPLAYIAAADLAAVLRRFRDGELSSVDVRSWATALEMRDDVGFLEHDRLSLGTVVFELANPEIHDSLTATRAEELRKVLQD